MDKKRFTILDFARKKNNNEKITMLTAYDYPMAKQVDISGVDSILVGDSLGMVMLGYSSTQPVTMDEMIHHAKSVRRAAVRAFVIGDMPFMSFQASDEDAIRNAGRFVKEAGMDAVKLEGGKDIIGRVKAVIAAGIPVIGHIGLTPQNVSKLGGYKVQGKDDKSAKKLHEDALLLEEAGCFAVLLECVPMELAREVTTELQIPTIGIGAGPYCDGQVLVTHDIIGYFDKFTPKFVKKYANVNEVILNAIKDFKKETEENIFPDGEHSFS